MAASSVYHFSLDLNADEAIDIVKSTETQCPNLPPELWSEIFSRVTYQSYTLDDCFLWMTCRLVCRMFKIEVEFLLATQRLPQTEIWFRLHKTHPNFQFLRSIPEVSARFSRLSDDKSRAIFVLKEHVRSDFHTESTQLREPDGSPYAWYSKLFREECQVYLPDPYRLGSRDIGRTFYDFRIGSNVNNTEIPELQVDEGLHELSLDWRGMCSNFFKEEQYARLLRARAMSKQDNEQRLDFPTQYPIRINNFPLNRLMNGMWEAEREVYQKAFLHRICTYYQEQYAFDINSKWATVGVPFGLPIHKWSWIRNFCAWDHRQRSILNFKTAWIESYGIRPQRVAGRRGVRYWTNEEKLSEPREEPYIIIETLGLTLK